jgi:hypothetical protein
MLPRIRVATTTYPIPPGPILWGGTALCPKDRACTPSKTLPHFRAASRRIAPNARQPLPGGRAIVATTIGAHGCAVTMPREVVRGFDNHWRTWLCPFRVFGAAGRI